MVSISHNVTLAGDAAPELGLQDGMIDRGEVAEDVGAQHVSVVVAVALVDADRGVRALARPIGERVADEAGLEDRVNYGAQRVVHHTVAEWRGGDEALLRIVHENLDVAAGAVAAVKQLALQAQ
jgi:hypothetical protein